MEIDDEDWQRVVEAYERGRRAEQGRLTPAEREEMLSSTADDWVMPSGLDEARIRKELRQLKRLLAKFDPETIVEIEADLGSGALGEAIDTAIRSMSIPLRDGRPRPYAYREAVAVMRELRPGKKGPRYTVAGEQANSEYESWLGANLKRLDPENLRADEVAWTAAWNALAALDAERKPKPVPGTGAPSRG